VEVVGSKHGTSEVSTIGLSNRDTEIEVAARWAHGLVKQGRTRIAVVVEDLAARSESVRRSFAEVFDPSSRTIEQEAAQAPFAIAAPQPLARYPIVDAALAALELMKGDCDSTLAGRLFRSPFFADALQEADARALADARLRQEQREQWNIYELERFSALTECTTLAMAAREAAQRHRELPARAPASTWAQEFHALLRLLGWPGERGLSSVEQQTILKFQATLTDLGSLDALLGPITLAQAHRELRKLANDTAFEAETAAALVTVIDATTVAGMHFDAIWVAGLDALRFPKPAQPDALIPLPLQRLAAVPEASPELSYKLSQTRLERLTRSARKVVLSWPQREGDAQLQMSPLIASFPKSTAADFTRVDDLRSLIFHERPALEVLQDERAPALQSAHAKGGARILELQSLCPFRAQATLRLGAEPLMHATPGFDARHRGIFIHRLLEEFWSQTRDQATLIAMDASSLEARLIQIAESLAVRWLPPSTRARERLAQLEIRSAVERVIALLAIDRARPAFGVRRIEGEERVSIAGLTFRLQPDRIDEVAGGTFLIDYKLGDAHRPRKWLDRKPGRPEQPQLPLYALGQTQLAGLAFATLAPGSIEYRGWRRGDPIAPGVLEFPNEVRRAPGIPEDWNSLLAHWRVVLHALAEHYVRGDSQVDPLPQACAYCHLSSFCRIHERGAAVMAEEGDADE
jgi:probable DNA repair protein